MSNNATAAVALVLAFLAGLVLAVLGVRTGDNDATLCAFGIWSAAFARGIPRPRNSRTRNTDEHETPTKTE